VETLVEAARGLLGASGGDLSEATIERVRATLHAGAIDADARDEVAAGRAARERSPQGLFGADPFAAPAPRRPAKAVPEPEPQAKRKPATKAKAKPKDTPDGAAERVDKAQRALAQAQERTARAAERLEEAQAREREAAEALGAARSELDALEPG
jgi:hypothetical protein